MKLDSSTRTLQAILAGAVSTTNPDVVVSYTDTSNRVENPLGSETQCSSTNGANAVTILDAPDKNTLREVDSITLHNRDTATVTATIRLDDAGTAKILIRAALLTGETLHYAKGHWKTLDANGNLKQ